MTGALLLVWLSTTASLAVWEWMRAKLLLIQTTDGPVLTSRYAKVVFATALALVAVVFTILLNQAAPPIVYKAI